MDDFENENYYSKFISSSKDDEERFVSSSRIESDDVIENVIVKYNLVPSEHIVDLLYEALIYENSKGE